jgi:hypothetical protein
MGLVFFAACAIVIPASQGQQSSQPQPRSQARLRTPPIQRRYYERTTAKPTPAVKVQDPARGRAFQDDDARAGEGPEDGAADQRDGSQDSSRLGWRRDALGGQAWGGRESEQDDLLSHYGSQNQPHVLRPGHGSASLGNFTPAPVRTQAVPQVRHDYFPGMRTGRAQNRNVPGGRHHCVPGRGQLLGRRR